MSKFLCDTDEHTGTSGNRSLCTARCLVPAEPLDRESRRLINDYLRDLITDIRFSRQRIKQAHGDGGEGLPFCRCCEPEARFLNENLREFRRKWKTRHAPKFNQFGFPQ